MRRRDFLNSFAGFSATLALGHVGQLKNDGLARIRSAAAAAGNADPVALADDESYWALIQQAFDVDRSLVNLNNGGVCPSPKVVMQAFERYLEYSNTVPVYSMWRILEPQIEGVRQRLARLFGADPEEMAITRNASEALEIAQLGIALEPGDEVLTTDQDYPRMITTWQQRARREGITIKEVPFLTPPPGPKTLVDMFEQAIGPKTKVLHFCHITNLTGQIFPVRDICRMARRHNLITVVDGAHAFAHFPFTYADLECDYYGTSLHKWLLAPIGTGFLYVRRERIKNHWPMMPAPESMDDNIRKFEEIGTHPAANHNAIAEALTFHEAIGGERKAARLRYLRDRWMKRLQGQRGVQLHTSFDPAQSCGLANVGIEGIEPGEITSWLWSRYHIIVTPIGHPACTGIRVTPNVYTTVEEVDRFAEAMEQIIRAGAIPT